ncbi:MAG: hypothetical protein ACKOX6_10890 [Bdellovibrio sp.]
MIKRSASDIQFIAVTFVLVALLGVPTFASLVESDEISASATVEPATSLAQNVVGVRSPSSVAAVTIVPQKVTSTLHQSADFDLNCTKKSADRIAVKGSYLQLRGKSCVRGYAIGQIEIVNKSNGYTASVFDRGSDKYQTDLIQLSKGENEITIRYKAASGKSVEEVLRISAPLS